MLDDRIRPFRSRRTSPPPRRGVLGPGPSGRRGGRRSSPAAPRTSTGHRSSPDEIQRRLRLVVRPAAAGREQDDGAVDNVRSGPRLEPDGLVEIGEGRVVLLPGAPEDAPPEVNRHKIGLDLIADRNRRRPSHTSPRRTGSVPGHKTSGRAQDRARRRDRNRPAPCRPPSSLARPSRGPHRPRPSRDRAGWPGRSRLGPRPTPRRLPWPGRG